MKATSRLDHTAPKTRDKEYFYLLLLSKNICYFVGMQYARMRVKMYLHVIIWTEKCVNSFHEEV